MTVAVRTCACGADLAEASSCMACMEPERYDDHGCNGRCDECLAALRCGFCGDGFELYDGVVEIGGEAFHAVGCALEGQCAAADDSGEGAPV